jgi:hypothetical protein
MGREDWSDDWLTKYNERLKKLASSEGLAPAFPVKRPVDKSKVVRLKTAPLDRLPDAFQALCVAEGLPRPVRELLFHPVRKWRFDYAWREYRVAVEVDGGAWVAGRHTRGSGFIEDQRKMNAAVQLGWRVLHTTPDRLHEACSDVKMLLRPDSA